MAKVYSLNALVLIAWIYMLLRWGEGNQAGYLYAFAFLYGLSLLNYLVMATAAAGFLAYIGIITWRQRHTPGFWRSLPMAAVAGLLGLTPYLFLLARTGTAGGALGTMAGFLRGLGYVALRPSALLLGVWVGLALLLYQFPATLLPGFLGMRCLGQQRKPEAWMLGLAALGDVLFLLAAADPRAGGEYWWNLHYYLQMYVIFSLWIAAGLASLWPRLGTGRARLATTLLLTIALPIVLYALAPVVARPFFPASAGTLPIWRIPRLRYRLTEKAQEFG